MEKEKSLNKGQLTSGSLLAKNATINLLTEGWIFLVLIVTMPRLVAYLGETLFGLFSLAWVVIGYLAFLDIGVGRAATKFISEHLAKADNKGVEEVARTAFTANLVLGVAGGLVVASATPFLVHSVFKISPDLQYQARLVFYCVALSVPVLLVSGVLRAILTSFQRFDWINGVNGVATAVQWLLACWLAWKGHGIALVVLATVLTRMAATVVYGLLLVRLLPRVSIFQARGLVDLLKLLRFGSWVTVSQLVSPVLVYLDRVFLASFVSLSAVTLYTVPYEVMTRLRIIPTSLVTTLYPAFSERGAGQDRSSLHSLYDNSVRYLLLILMPGILFLLILGGDVLSVWMGTQFAKQASVVLQILAFGVLLNCLANVPYNALQALGRPDLPGKFHLLELPLYVGLCWFLIPHWGIAGAALANALRISLDAVLLFWAARKYCHCSPVSVWSKTILRVFVISVLLALALLGSQLIGGTAWMRLILGVLAVGLYFLTAWTTVVDRGDKPRISAALRTFIGEPTR